MVTVVSIVAIFAMIAMPNMTDMMTNDKLRVSGTDLMSSLLLARSEAIKRNAQVEVRPASVGDWTQGWIVDTVANAEQLDKKNPLGNRVQVNLAPGSIVYDRNGRLTSVGIAQVEFADTQARATTRCVTVTLSGLPRLTSGSCA
jgi:type IV fimbrial biogenesis protein FimT